MGIKKGMILGTFLGDRYEEHLKRECNELVLEYGLSYISLEHGKDLQKGENHFSTINGGMFARWWKNIRDRRRGDKRNTKVHDNDLHLFKKMYINAVMQEVYGDLEDLDKDTDEDAVKNTEMEDKGGLYILSNQVYALSNLEVNTQEILGLFNRTVEIQTGKELGYMTYVYKLMISDNEGIKLSTYDILDGDDIKDKDKKEVFIKDPKLGVDDVYNLLMDLEYNHLLEKDYQSYLEQEESISSQESIRVQQLEYLRENKDEYEEVEELSQKYLANEYTKNRWDELENQVNHKRLLLQEENKKLLENNFGG